MNRLQSELHRLYLPRAAAAGDDRDATAPTLFDAHGGSRALVLEIARPADWDAVARVWRGVQTELDLPAPAIAVSGTDGYQLWFSLAESVSVPRAHAFLDALRRHFLADVAPERIGLMPAMPTPASGEARHARIVPAEQAQPGQWSAFVAPDLAAIFADTPWLDLQPGGDGQADLLCRLASIGPAEFEAVAARLAGTGHRPETASTPPGRRAAPAPATSPAEPTEPAAFLLGVMRDETVDLALRIEAAKALLPHFDGISPRRDH